MLEACRSLPGSRGAEHRARIRVASLAIPAALLALAGASCATASARARTAAVEASASVRGGGLVAALAALSPSGSGQVEADVRFLASAELRGRDTPSRGLEAAAAYLEAGARAAGMQPGARGSYRAPYELFDAGLDVAASEAALRVGDVRFALRPGSDYAVRPQEVVEHDTRGALLFAGHGDKDELAELDVEGHWLLVWDSELSWSRRALYARRAGAVGVLVASDPEAAGAGPPSWAEASLRTAPRRPTPGRANRAPLPSVWVASDVLASALRVAGDDPAALQLGQELDVEFHERRRAVGAIDVDNVAALWPGSDPGLAGEVIVLLAHFDHVGVQRGKVHPGADDNASGTAALLAVARGLAAGGPLRRSVLLLWVSGEERGLLGSRAWAADPQLPPGLRPVAAFNLDMVGRNAPEFLTVTPSPRHDEYNDLVRMLERLAPREDFPLLTSGDEGWRRSDHYALHLELGLPVAFLSSDEHADYHEPTDTADRVDFGKVARVGRLLLRALWELDGRSSLPPIEARVPASAE